MCTSALVSWDKPTNDSGVAIVYNIQWRLLGDDNMSGPGSGTVSGRQQFMLESLMASDDNTVRRYSVRVSSVRQGVEGNSSEVIFSTNTNGNSVGYSNQLSDTIYIWICEDYL